MVLVGRHLLFFASVAALFPAVLFIGRLLTLGWRQWRAFWQEGPQAVAQLSVPHHDVTVLVEGRTRLTADLRGWLRTTGLALVTLFTP